MQAIKSEVVLVSAPVLAPRLVPLHVAGLLARPHEVRHGRPRAPGPLPLTLELQTKVREDRCSIYAYQTLFTFALLLAS